MALVSQGGAIVILAIAVLWLAPRVAEKAAKSRELVAKQHTEDVNRICAVFQQELRYEREQCTEQFREVMEKISEHHDRVLKELEAIRSLGARPWRRAEE